MSESKRQEMKPEALEKVATRFRVLGEPQRLRILQLLEGGDCLSVTQIVESVGSTQPNVSKHLRILQEEGLVSRRQEGNTVYYGIADETVFALCDVVCSSLKRRFEAQAGAFGP